MLRHRLIHTTYVAVLATPGSVYCLLPLPGTSSNGPTHRHVVVVPGAVGHAVGGVVAGGAGRRRLEVGGPTSGYPSTSVGGVVLLLAPGLGLVAAVVGQPEVGRSQYTAT